MMRYIVFLVMLLWTAPAFGVVNVCTITQPGPWSFNCDSGADRVTDAVDTACTASYGTMTCDEGGTADNDDLITINPTGGGVISCDGHILMRETANLGGAIQFRGSSTTFKCHADTQQYDIQVGRGDAGQPLEAQGLRFVDLVAGNEANADIKGYFVNSTTGAKTLGRTNDNIFHVGGLLHCPNSGSQDCSLDPYTMRLDWATDPFNNNTTYTRDLESGLAGITAGDVICFIDDDTSDTYHPADANNCYKTTNIDATFPAHIEFDVRQGDDDTFAFPHTRRKLGICEICTSGCATKGAVDAMPGETRLYVDVSGVGLAGCDDIFPSDGINTGRWIRPLIETIYQPRKILYADVDAGPLEAIIDVFPGITLKWSSGDDVVIDYGWMPGDPFVVFQPVKIFPYNQACDGTNLCPQVIFNGDADIQGVWFDNLMDVQFGTSGSITNARDLWFMDFRHEHVSGDNTVLLGADGGVMENISISGGRATQCFAGPYTPTEQRDCGHGISVTGDDTAIRDASMRHLGDDGVFLGTATDTSLTVERLHVAFMQDRPDSGQMCIDSASLCTGTCSTIARDITCDGNVTHADATTGVTAPVNLQHAGDRVTNLVLWGGRENSNPFQVDATGTYENVAILGWKVAPGAATGSILPSNIKNFFVWDFKSTAHLRQWPQTVDDTLIQNGVLVKVDIATTTETPGELDDGLIDNVAFYDMHYTGCSQPTCSPVTISDDATASDLLTMRNVTFAWTSTQGANKPFANAISIDGAASGSTDISGILVSNQDRRSDVAALPSGNDSFVDYDAGVQYGTMCVYDNNPAVTALLDGKITTLVGDYSTGFRHTPIADSGVVNPIPSLHVRSGSPYEDAGCGIRRNPPPGVCTPSNALSKSKLPTLCMVHPDHSPAAGLGGRAGGGGGGGSRLRPY